MRRVVRKRLVRGRGSVDRFEFNRGKNKQVIIGIGVLVLFLVVINLVDRQVLFQPGPSGFSQIDLSWTDNANNEDGFLLERSEDASFNPSVSPVNTFPNIAPSNPVSASGVQINFVDDGTLFPLENEKNYFYRVLAFNVAGQSVYATTSVTTPSVPTAPTIVSLSPNPVVNNIASNGVITITGTGFTPTSIVNIDGIGNLPSNLVTYVSPTTIVFDISLYIVGLNGLFDIQVANGALVSNVVQLSIIEPPNPIISSVFPSLIPFIGEINLVLTGGDMGPNSIIEFNFDTSASVPVWVPLIPDSWTTTELRVDSIDLATLGGVLTQGQNIDVRFVNSPGGPTSNVYTVIVASACTTTPPSCPGQGVGVCLNVQASCNVQTTTWECNYPATYGAEVCDGLDNDCDGTVDNNLVAPQCLNQNGVCLGSVQTCGGNQGWLSCTSVEYGASAATFGTVYNPNEICFNGYDNSCSGNPYTNSQGLNVCTPGAPTGFSGTPV